MAKSSIHVRPVMSSSEEHNQRLKPLDYVKQELSQDNSYLVKTSIPEKLKEIKANYRATVKQKMQKDATPIREAVVVLDKKTTMKDLEKLSENMEKRFGLKTFQIHIHEDEGHTNQNGHFVKNRHAHMVIDWTEKNTGKTVKMDKQDMSELQTMVAETLGMERGLSSSKQHLTAIQFKAEAKKEELREAEIKFKEVRLNHYKANLSLQMTKMEHSATKTSESLKKASLGVFKRITGQDKTSELINEAQKEIERLKKELEKQKDLSRQYGDEVAKQGRTINEMKDRDTELTKMNIHLEFKVKRLETPLKQQGKDQGQKM